MSQLLPSVLPLFPLPNVVLFPKTFAPLHVFEPRYREMVQDAMEGGRMIGMLLLQEGWDTDYYGAPPIKPVGCAGEIVHLQRLSDGRFNIVLKGIARFGVQQEFQARSYRQAWIQAWPESEAALPPPLKAELLRVLDGYARQEGLERPVRTLLERGPEDDLLVNLLSDEVEFTPEEKQFLLESDDLVQQTKRLIQLLEFQRKERPVSHSGVPPEVEPGTPRVDPEPTA